jgi:hypothetical protein
MAEDERPAWLPEVDLRPVTRNSDRAFTRITVSHNTYRHVWIQAGLLTRIEMDPGKRQWLAAYYAHDITDESDHSAYAFSLELVGVHVHMITYGVTELHGWIASGPHDAEHFRVPKAAPDLNSFEWCQRCKGKERHRMTTYQPPAELELYKKLRGEKISIEFGPVIPEDER